MVESETTGAKVPSSTGTLPLCSVLQLVLETNIYRTFHRCVEQWVDCMQLNDNDMMKSRAVMIFATAQAASARVHASSKSTEQTD